MPTIANMGRLTRLAPGTPTSPFYDEFRYKQGEELAKQPPKEQHCVRCHATFVKDDGTRCRVPHVYKPEREADWCSQGIKGCLAACCGAASVKIRATAPGGGRPIVVEKLGDPYCHDGWEHTANPRDVKFNDWSFEMCQHNKNGRCVARVVCEPEGSVIFKDEWDALRWGTRTVSPAALHLAPSPVSKSPISPDQTERPEMPLTLGLAYYHCDSGSSVAGRIWTVRY